MAEILPPPVCEKNKGSIVPGGHCWHTIWTPSPYQPGQHDGREMKCCWCGEVAPLSIGYNNAPIPHGSHAPSPLPQPLPNAAGFQMPSNLPCPHGRIGLYCVYCAGQNTVGECHSGCKE